jgi:hypothetical protein
MIVHELTAAARDAAIAAYTSVHGDPPDFGFAPDRAWMEGFAHAAALVAEPVEGAEPFGYVTTDGRGVQWFYKTTPYLDNAVECVTVYRHPAPASAQAGAVRVHAELEGGILAPLGWKCPDCGQGVESDHRGCRILSGHPAASAQAGAVPEAVMRAVVYEGLTNDTPPRLIPSPRLHSALMNLRAAIDHLAAPKAGAGEKA